MTPCTTPSIQDRDADADPRSSTSEPRRRRHQPEDSSNRRPSRLLLRPRTVSSEQQRKADRTTTKRLLTIRTGAGEPITARIVDVSSTGLRLELPAEAATDLGNAFTIEALPGRQFAATTRWIRLQNDEMILGAQWDSAITFQTVWRIRSHAD